MFAYVLSVSSLLCTYYGKLANAVLMMEAPIIFPDTRGTTRHVPYLYNKLQGDVVISDPEEEFFCKQRWSRFLEFKTI